MNQQTFRVVVIGGGSVGKSCLTTQFIHGKFSTDYDPTIETHLEIIDTAGQEEYRSIRDRYLGLGDGFLVVYSIISRSSFDDAKNLHQAIKRTRTGNKAIALTVANKSDLDTERVVSRELGQELAKDFGSIYYETSAKTGSNVVECFHCLIRELRKSKKPEDSNNKKFDDDDLSEKEKTGKCCIIL
ncbi:ras-like protein [Anaeramoeba ignava]|uniref:Ras-like protein n=1 Tax=Anaeramoeba ignava TaxID=1746090 RepID=A0A9Q0LEK3_ANAIG|nr:ras-like protein [Anaeramoeba ignava]